jgi:hypothetical protein
MQHVLRAVLVEPLGSPERRQRSLGHGQILGKDGEVKVTRPVPRIERIQADLDGPEQVRIGVAREHALDGREVSRLQLVEGVLPAIRFPPNRCADHGQGQG